MITSSTIAFGDQLGAQMTKLAALMYVGIQTEQDVVFWKELKEYKRGLQFLDVFDIDGLQLIKRSCNIINRFVDRYSRASRHADNWKKQMNRIYKGRIYRIMDKLLYVFVKRQYADFLTIKDLHNGIYTDKTLYQLQKDKNYDIQNGFGTYRDWGQNAGDILERIHFQKWVQMQGNEILKRLPEDRKRIAVHLRRTDYLVMSSLNLQDDYYSQAMSCFDTEKVCFIVFSDDIEECKKMPLFKGKDVIFMDRHPAAIDMYLMSQMDGNIIANSTFSVWGALLNQKAEKVVCPHDFIGPEAKEVLYINGNYYPEEWIAI